MDLWLIMIVFHAVSAVVCLATGFALLSPARTKRYPWLMTTFIASLIGMIIFMVAATVSHWYDISVIERIIFSGLPLLGVYMLYRGIKAKHSLKQHKPARYIDDIGFSIISLFNGFFIVALIDLHAPPILIPLVVIAVTILGSKYLKATKQKIASPHSGAFHD